MPTRSYGQIFSSFKKCWPRDFFSVYIFANVIDTLYSLMDKKTPLRERVYEKQLLKENYRVYSFMIFCDVMISLSLPVTCNEYNCGPIFYIDLDL